MVVLPGETGVFDVLSDHENTLEYLKKGEMKIVSGEEESTFGINDGIALIARNENDEFTVSVLVDNETQQVRPEGGFTRREVER